MAHIIPPAERSKPVAQPDPLRGVSEAIARLVSVIEAQRQQPAPVIPAIQFPDHPVRPSSLEATIVRDKAGKMQRIVITPVY